VEAISCLILKSHHEGHEGHEGGTKKSKVQRDNYELATSSGYVRATLSIRPPNSFTHLYALLRAPFVSFVTFVVRCGLRRQYPLEDDAFDTFFEHQDVKVDEKTETQIGES
jgi:hypothetical protein